MTAPPVQPQRVEFVRAISRLDATALVVGSMIGSGIVTMLGALTYGELAAMFPKAGGQYVYLREGISPVFGFLYGWTLFTVIQTATIAAVAVAFARFTGILFPSLTEHIFL